jgi:dynein heavy chain
VFDATDPAAAPLPAPWASRLSAFQKLLLLRVLRPDKLKSAMHAFVKASLGQKFVESQPLDLEACYADSSATTPLIFVLSPGSDPMSTLLRFAERLKVPVRPRARPGVDGAARQRRGVPCGTTWRRVCVRSHTC